MSHFANFSFILFNFDNLLKCLVLVQVEYPDRHVFYVDMPGESQIYPPNAFQGMPYMVYRLR
jgi:hypothetical protein